MRSAWAALRSRLASDPLPARGRDHIDGHGMLLAEPPAAADGLVVRLERVVSEVRHAVAVLVVQAPRGDPGLRDQDPDLAPAERGKAFLLRLHGVRAADLHCAVDQPREQVALVIQVTPGYAGLGIGEQFRSFLAPLGDGAPRRLALLLESYGGHVEQGALLHGAGRNDVSAGSPAAAG